MKTQRLVSLTFALLLMGIADQSQATVITADATGPNNLSTVDFWGVSFTSGMGFIQSVSFDITAGFVGTQPAFFDFDGSANFGGSFAPVIGALSGLNLGDISVVTSNFVPNPDASPQEPQIVTFNFLPNSFGVGDSFRWSADTDFCAGDPASGVTIAQCGALFSATMQGGASGSAPFMTTPVANQSIATVNIPMGQVPEPSTLGLLVLALVGIGFGRRK